MLAFKLYLVFVGATESARPLLSDTVFVRRLTVSFSDPICEPESA